MISNTTRRAYSEIDSFLELLGTKYKNEIPQNIREIFKTQKDSSHVKYMRNDIPIEEQNFMKETLAIIAFLNLQYWCKDEKEKQRFMKIYEENNAKYSKTVIKKLSANNDSSIVDTNTTITAIAECKKESFFRRIINKIIEFFNFD